MFIKEIELINYVGIYNGIGIEDLYIDFTKSNKGLYIIIGDNGSGKSTLLDALSPLPEDNSSFIKERQAEKLLTIIHNNIEYKIHCIHPVDSKGNRTTGKIYFYKILPDGTELNMNPNGNITSYKEVLYDEFTLDPNFLSLSALSSMNKGIGLMTSGERKKYVNSIISSLSTYNDIFKVLCKRSNVFKGMLNNLSNKISSIGDIEKLNMTYESINNRINSLIKEKDNVSKELSNAQSRVELLDPNGTIQESYNNIYNKLSQNKTKLDSINLEIQKILVNSFKVDKETTYDEILELNNQINSRYSDLEVKIRVEETNINNILSEREKESEILQDKIAKLNATQLDSINLNIDLIIQQTKDELNRGLEQLSVLGLDINSTITKEEFITGIEILNNIREIIIAYNSDKDYDMIIKAFDFIESKSEFHDVQELDTLITNYTNQKNELIIKYNRLCEIEKTLDVLDKRPSNCSIPSCPFIKSALENKDILEKENIKEIEDTIHDLDDKVLHIQQLKFDENELKMYVNVINNIIRDIKIQSSILNKLPLDMSKFYDFNTLKSMIIGRYDFPEIQVLYENIQYADAINIVKDTKEKLTKLENEYDKIKAKKLIIDEIEKDVEELTSKINLISNSLEDKQKEISSYKDELSTLNTMKLCFNNIMSLYKEQKNLLTEKSSLISSFNNIKNDITTIKQSLDLIYSLEDKLEFINKELNPLNEDRENIKFNIEKLKEYKEELEIFNNKYQKVETIKKYCSPSKEGIQNIYIELYMNTTLQLSNEILSLLFDGRYMIPNFEINDKEFNIPIMGNGMMNDDVSSMSNGEISMISMIISIAILHQSSSVYNIIKLDEVDAPLDSTNRLQFTFVLEKIREMLNIEQTIMITHNSEIDYNNASLIVFKTNDYEKYKDYDIIFDINKE